jgi:hypothetical protein
MKMKISTIASLAAQASFLMMASTASAAPYNPARLSNDEVVRVSGVCEKVMGLSPRDMSGQYKGCVDDLSDIVAARDADSQGLGAESTCQQKGLAAGSTELYECMVQTVDTKGRGGASLTQANYSPKIADPSSLPQSSSLAGVSPSERLHRERMACAAIGLDPVTASFNACVNNMSDKFYEINNRTDRQ